MSGESLRTGMDRASVERVSFTQGDSFEGSHTVEFYSDDQSLLDNLTRAIGAALVAGDSAIVIATSDHRHRLAQLFASRGLDLELPIQEGRYVALDASETLTKFMVDG